MALHEYWQKRDFSRTPEPHGQKQKAPGFSFTVQKHAARRLHYDFRLELDGVLLSWAVPKGPSLDPKIKRLAVQTEDHPIEYGKFEGVIPSGEYGAGTVLVWDYGHWQPEGDPHAGYAKGHLRFTLEGEKLHGGFHLVRTRGKDGKNGKSWLLFKGTDDQVRKGAAADLPERRPESVLTGRDLAAVRSDPDRIWHSDRDAKDERAAPVIPAGARKAGKPAFVEPQLATLVDEAPAGDDWLHEIKLDGYRIMALIDRGKSRLLTRRGHDWTERMPSVARALDALPIERALLDGEVAVLNDQGVSEFQRLQNTLGQGGESACIYFAFDLLQWGDRDLRQSPLIERKRVLREALAAAGAPPGRIRFSDHQQGSGPAFFAQACKHKLEGIVSKRAAAGYASGRSRGWLKVKCTQRQEFVIGGFTEPAGARSHLGALLLGVRDGDGLAYAGKVGTGFTAESLAELRARLAPLEQKQPPFHNPPRGAEARNVHWLRPELVAEVAFAERTDEGFVRHASFQGLRDDKPAKEVRAERAQAVKRPKPATAAPAARASRPKPATLEVRLTHPDRILYPEQQITKRELALYYASVADSMLPHVARRPLMLVRCPEGQQGQCFHQKHPTKGQPKAIHKFPLREDKGVLESMMIDDAQGLVSLVQMGALEIHTWGCRSDAIEYPDQLVFDLDPDTQLPYPRIAQAARDVRERLQALGLTGFVKTTGGKGLHVVVPIEPRSEWPAAKQFGKQLVESLVRDAPKHYVATMSKRERAGKIFLDYLRNGRGATAVCVFSTRALPNAPIALPLAWDELDTDPRVDPAAVRNVTQRLRARPRDPWAEFDAARAPLPEAGGPKRPRVRKPSRGRRSTG